MIDTTSKTRQPCPVPPHPQLPENAGLQPVVPGAALSRFWRWAAHAPAERVPLPAVPAVWTAAEIMHAAGAPWTIPGAATAAATLAAGWAAERRARNSEHPHLKATEVAAVTGATGAWVIAAAEWGPLAGGVPYWLTLAYLTASAGGYVWLRRHEAVKAARARRDAKAEDLARKAAWHRLAALLGLYGSHLLDSEDTLLGETWLIDTRGTGKLASQLSLRAIGERLGEIEMIPAGRIDVTTDHLPGRIRITIRRNDPWARPLMHPVTHPDSPFAQFLEDPATCRKPLAIGGDPETGDPLRLTLWDEDEGGKVIMITAKKGSGKTVLLSCISERITACADAILIQVNLGKHREDKRWAPLAAANALGRDDLGRARRSLQWVVDAIEERSKSGGDSKVQPTPETPLIVVKVDEVDQVARDPVCKQLLSDIASKCRSEAVCLIFAGQRATAQWVGGADLRANVDIAVLGRVARRGEAAKATGEEVDLPDMGAYGEGKPGVWLITELGGGGGYDRGRVFMLEDPAEIDAIVARRLKTRRPYMPEPALAGLAGLWAKVTGDAPGDDEDYGTGAPVSVLPGTDDITAKVGAALGTLAEGDAVANALPVVPSGMQDHYAAMLAERRRQALAANYGDTDIPPRMLPVLVRLLGSPRGTTASETGQAIGKSKSVAFRYLSAMRAADVARLDGSGRGARFRLASAPGGESSHPGLTLAPPPDEREVTECGDEREAVNVP